MTTEQNSQLDQWKLDWIESNEKAKEGMERTQELAFTLHDSDIPLNIYTWSHTFLQCSVGGESGEFPALYISQLRKLFEKMGYTINLVTVSGSAELGEENPLLTMVYHLMTGDLYCGTIWCNVKKNNIPQSVFSKGCELVKEIKEATLNQTSAIYNMVCKKEET